MICVMEYSLNWEPTYWKTLKNVKDFFNKKATVIMKGKDEMIIVTKKKILRYHNKR